MNAGYLSLLLVVVSLILFASGWKDIILRGITPTSLLLFFVSWILASRVSFAWGPVTVNGAIGVLILTGVVTVLRTKGMMLKLHVFSVALLMGSVYFFLRETLHLMPSLIVWNVQATMALFIGIIDAVLLRSAALQLAALAAALLIGEGMYLYAHRDQGELVFGTPSLLDFWWLTAFAARGYSLGLESLLAAGKKTLQLVTDTLRTRKP